MERWLADRRREFEHHIQTANTTTARLFARAEEARLAELDFIVDTSLEPGVPELEAASALVTAWADAARIELSAAHLEVRAAESAHDAARLATEEATEAVRRQERLAELTAELTVLRAAEPEQARRRGALAAASHAAVLAPLLTELDRAQRRAQVAERRWTAAQLAARAAAVDPLTVSAEQVSELRGELGTLTELLTAERDLGRLEAQRSAGQQQIEDGERDRADADRMLAELTVRQAELTEQRSAAELIAVTLPAHEQAAARATTIAKAVLEQQKLAARRTAVEDGLRSAIDVHQSAVAHSQRLRAGRLDGMAAELAGRLGPDQPCPVCGSAEHPAPAAAAGAAVTEQAQHRAEAAEATALVERETAAAAVNTVAQRWAALAALTEGTTAETAAAALDQAQWHVVEARTARTQAQQAAAELASVAGQLGVAADRQRAAALTASSAREALAQLDGRRTELRDRLEHGRGEDSTVRARHHRLSLAVGAVAECLAAREDRDQSAERLDQARTAAVQGTTAAGFADPAAAQRALLPTVERDRQARELADHDAQLARLEALLAEASTETVQGETTPDDATPEPAFQLDLFADPGPAAPRNPRPRPAAPAEPPDLDQLRGAQAQARTAHELARKRHTLAAHAVHALSGLAAELDAHALATAPLRRQFLALDSVSKCVEGTGGDNTLRMRLSSYVLAARLEQVAEAASLRLAAMSGGRYLLVHTDGPSRGGARSGLGLAVIDGWTGVQRDPASLSGGETFCTSLALALGLADVVQAEAGGSVIETLLVDEGFGSLDEQTLDEVMDVLDGLRSAGRSVGLVSHVADLRDRIPAQLQVKKSRTGSRLIA